MNASFYYGNKTRLPLMVDQTTHTLYIFLIIYAYYRVGFLITVCLISQIREAVQARGIVTFASVMSAQVRDLQGDLIH